MTTITASDIEVIERGIDHLQREDGQLEFVQDMESLLQELKRRALAQCRHAWAHPGEYKQATHCVHCGQLTDYGKQVNYKPKLATRTICV